MLFNRYALIEARKKAGLSKSQLAKAAGNSAPYQTQVESGDRPSPSLRAIEAWAKATGTEDPKAFYLDPTIDELLRAASAARAVESTEQRAS